MRSFLVITLLSSLLTMPQAHSQPTHSIPSASLHTYSSRLRPGQDLKKEMETVVRREHIEAGAILTCVGSLTDVTLRLANQEKASGWQGHFEIVSLVGTLSTSGSHIHLSVADSTGRTIGGHLLDGCIIYTTAEIVIGVMPDLIYAREPDPAFGYHELVVRKKKRK